MIANIISYITRREGRKFLQLKEQFDDSFTANSIMGNEQQPALYIHIPFCRTLCPFCCFNRYLFKEDTARQYFKHLRKELDMYIDRGFKFSNFYFGGGTPPILMDELLAFIDYLTQRFDVKEISLESTPVEINPKTVSLLSKAGIKRLSIGIQSFDDEILKNMGRLTLSGEQIKDRVMMAQGNFETVNLDLIFNFPFQSLEQFQGDIETFKSLKIDQATFYPLMASPHKRSALERKFNRVDTSREKKFYDVVLDELYDGGYHASTAWCYSRGQRMIDEYVIEYDDYVGIGSGSVGIINGNFFVNTFSLEKYSELINRGKLPITGWRKLTSKEALRYYLLTALFGLSVDTQKFHRRFQAGIEKKLFLEIQALHTFGIVTGKDQLKVTRKGMFPVNIMMRDFFSALNGLREHYIEEQK
jgi:coproporphyrinogen III oxidase-like Fe-S oxidoreductase